MIDALTLQAGGAGNQWLGGSDEGGLRVTAGTAGALTGTYEYVFTFATVTTGTGTVIGECLPGAPWGVTLSAQRAALTAIPVSASPACNCRRIYRTVAGGSQLKHVADILDNTTTTYSDNLPDGSLGANVPTVDTSDQSIYSSQNYLWRAFWGV